MISVQEENDSKQAVCRNTIRLGLVASFLTAALTAATPVAVAPNLNGTVGVAASESQLLFTQPFCATANVTRGVYAVDPASAAVSLYSAIPETGTCIENAITLASNSNSSAGFVPGTAYVTSSASIYAVPPGGGTATKVTITGAALTDSSNHSAITFDNVGTFGFNLLYSSSDGVWEIKSTGAATKLAPGLAATNVYLEGLAVAPSSFPNHGGQLFFAVEDNSNNKGSGPASGFYYLSGGSLVKLLGTNGVQSPEGIAFLNTKQVCQDQWGNTVTCSSGNNYGGGNNYNWNWGWGSNAGTNSNSDISFGNSGGYGNYGNGGGNQQQICSLTVKGTQYAGFITTYSKSTAGFTAVSDSLIDGLTLADLTPFVNDAIVDFEYSNGAVASQYPSVGTLATQPDVAAMSSAGSLTYLANIPTQLEGITTVTCNVPAPQKCPHDDDYYQANPTLWPTLTFPYKLGNFTYSQADFLKILSTPINGDAKIMLGQELIAAILNVAGGISNTALISQANQLLIDENINLLTGPTVPIFSWQGIAFDLDTVGLDYFNNSCKTQQQQQQTCQQKYGPNCNCY